MGTATGQAPYVQKLKEVVQPVATPGNDLNTIIGKSEVVGAISKVTYVPITTITGADANTRKVELYNKKQDGTGTTLIATLQFNAAINAAAGDEKTITLTAVAADLNVAVGDVLQWQSTHVGTGIADPGGEMFVEITRD